MFTVQSIDIIIATDDREDRSNDRTIIDDRDPLSVNYK